MEAVDKRRSKRMIIQSLLLCTLNIMNILMAYLSLTSSNLLYFNLVMIILLIDRVLSIIAVTIKNQYLQLFILDSLNLSFLARVDLFYFSEQQSILSYCVYFKALPSLLIQLIYFYLQPLAFSSMESNLGCIMLLVFQLNVFVIYSTAQTLIQNAKEFEDANNGIVNECKQSSCFSNILNVYCLYNMWVVILTLQQSNHYKYNICLWSVVIFIVLLLAELKQTKHLKSTIYALSSFKLQLKDVNKMSFYEMLVRKYHTLRLWSQSLIMLLMSYISYYLKKRDDGESVIEVDEITQAYQEIVKLITLFNILLTARYIYHICRSIQVHIHPQNRQFSKLVNLILDHKHHPFHIVILSNLSLFYDYFEIDNSILAQQQQNNVQIPDIDLFYFFSKIFEIIQKRNGSILIQSFLKARKDEGIIILDKNFKLSPSNQLSLLCNSQYIPNEGIFDIQFNQEVCNKVVLSRFSLGILFEETIQQKINLHQKNIFLAQNEILKLSLLQINAFSKQLKTLVINNPSQILYDLYEI